MSSETAEAAEAFAAGGRGPEKSATPAQLAFVHSAYGTAEGAVRLAEEKFGYVLLFLGILAAILGVRADALLSALTGPSHSAVLRALFLAGCLFFLGGGGISLVYAVRSRMLSADPPADLSQFLAHLAALEPARLIEELARALFKTADIAHRKLTLLQRCLAWAAVAFAGWAVVLLTSGVY